LTGQSFDENGNSKYEFLNEKIIKKIIFNYVLLKKINLIYKKSHDNLI